LFLPLLLVVVVTLLTYIAFVFHPTLLTIARGEATLAHAFASLAVLANQRVCSGPLRPSACRITRGTQSPTHTVSAAVDTHR
jgi:hypothetical protein